MADSIDQLYIDISSDSKSATTSIDLLVNTLGKLKNSTSGISRGLNTVSSSLGRLKVIKDVSGDLDTIVSKLEKLNNVNFNGKNINTVANALSRLATINTSGFDPGKIKSLTDAIIGLSATKGASDSVVNLTNALAKLAKSSKDADTSAKNLNALTKVVEGFAKEMNSIKPSDNVTVFLNSLAQLSSRSKSIESSMESIKNSMKGVGEQAKQTEEEVNDALRFEEGGNTGKNNVSSFVDSIKSAFDQLKKASEKGGINMDSISKSLQTAFPDSATGISETIGAVSKLGSAVGTVITVLKKMYDFVNKTFDSVKNKISEVVSVIKTGASQIAGFVSKVQGIASSLNPFRGAIKNITSDLGRMATMMVGFYGIRSLGNGLKSIVQYGSDITEVENIVDVAFRKMAQSAYDFADTATEQFGLSRVSALKFSGTMMSMFKSSGVAQKDAAEMSTTLAGLAGDLASFYNTDANTAFTKLSSGIMDSAKSLRVYGVNLTKANLEQYALSQGITQTYNSMSQAEKIALRYNYILAATSSQQGDFARTAGTYANQIRLLQMNIQSFGGAIGQGIIAAVLPAIRALNMLMSYLIAAANAFRNFMYIITGGKLKGAAKSILGISDDANSAKESVGGIGDAGGGASKGIDKANKSAKKLKKTLDLLSFDEINKLSEKTPSASGGAGGGGAGGAGGGLGDMDFGSDWGDFTKQAEKLTNKWAEEIRKAFKDKNWYKLGKVLADGVNSAVNWARKKVKWENLADKITGFTTAVTQTLNSFMNGVNWKNIGDLIGNGLDIAVKTANQFIGKGGIRFDLIGKAFSQMLLGVLDSNLDPKEIGQLIGNIINKTPKIVTGFVRDFSNNGGWQKIGIALGDAIKGVIETIDVTEWGETLGKVISGIAEVLSSSMDRIRQNGSFKTLGTKLGIALNNVFKEKPLEKTGEALGKLVDGIVTTLSNFIKTAKWDKIAEDFKNGINTFFDNFDPDTSADAVQKLIDGFMKIVRAGIEGLLENKDKIGKFVKNLDWAGIFSDYMELKSGAFKLKGSFLSQLFKGIASSILGYKQHDISDAITNSINESIGVGGGRPGGNVIEFTAKMKTKFSELVKDFKDGTINLKARIVTKLIDLMKSFFGDNNPIIDFIANLVGYNDKITDRDIENFELTINDFNDEIPSKELKGFIPIIKEYKDKLTKRQLDDIEAILTSTEDDIPEKEKKLTDYLVSIGIPKDEIPKKLKELGGFTSTINNFDDRISKTKRDIELYGRLNKYSENPNKSLPDATKSVKGKMDSYDGDPNKTLPTKTKNTKAKLNAYDGDPNRTLPTKSKGVLAYLSKWASDWNGLSTTKEVGVKAKANKLDTSKVSGTTISVKAKIEKFVGNSNLSIGGGSGHYTKADGGVYNNGRWEKIQKFAGGGSPNYGQLFVAREAGPELVSKIGARTAVMNNDQIVSSVSAGVYQATVAAIAPLVSAMANNNQRGDIAVYVGGRQMTDVVIQEINRKTRMTGQTPLLI